MFQPSGFRTEIPRYLLTMTQEDLEAQTAQWKPTKLWNEWLASCPAVLTALTNETQHHNGNIRREFVHSYADRDPVELFYVTMAWGFGATNVRWPGQRALLQDPPHARISGIVETVRSNGAEAGWLALYGEHRIRGLGYAFGTKLLFFAGYTSRCPGPRPLILDANVLSALHDAGTAILASGDVRTADFVAYLELAEQWAEQPEWSAGSPELVEYGLFERGGELNNIVSTRRSAGG